MYWNYRIIKDKKTLSVCAVYYENGKAILYTDPVKLDFFSNRTNLHWAYNLLWQAFDKPILNVEDIWDFTSKKPYTNILPS